MWIVYKLLIAHIGLYSTWQMEKLNLYLWRVLLN